MKNTRERTLGMRFLQSLTFIALSLSLSACVTSRVQTADSGKKGLLQGGATVSEAPRAIAAGKPPLDLPPMGSHSESGFSWPVNQGKITSFFGDRKRDYHEGIDVRAPVGTPIYAAKNGRVIYASRRIKGYGNMIVLRHDDGFSTVYAHNRKNLVKNGERVTQGQLMGFVGRTGKATGPHLHFEIRRGELPQDPLLYLPQVRTVASAPRGHESTEAHD